MTSQQFFIPQRLPGLNDLLSVAIASKGGHGRGNFYMIEKAKLGADIFWQIKVAKIKPVPRAIVHFEWHELNRSRDPDNVAAGGTKIILDALVNAKVLPDDGWEHVAGLTHRWVVDSRVGVMVRIEEVVHAQ